jgi:hypothetical protein
MPGTTPAWGWLPPPGRARHGPGALEHPEAVQTEHDDIDRNTLNIHLKPPTVSTTASLGGLQAFTKEPRPAPPSQSTPRVETKTPSTSTVAGLGWHVGYVAFLGVWIVVGVGLAACYFRWQPAALQAR